MLAERLQLGIFCLMLPARSATHPAADNPCGCVYKLTLDAANSATTMQVGLVLPRQPLSVSPPLPVCWPSPSSPAACLKLPDRSQGILKALLR